jgi:hypothetical protein
MKRFLRLATVGVASLAATACAAAMNVSSHVEPGLDFAQYRTYGWGPADALPTGDPRLDQNPFFQDHFQGSVEKGLAARGFEQSAAPDLLIHYHANVRRRIDIDRLDRQYGYCYDSDCQAGVTEHEAGTLVLDVVDARTNRLIWRGWAQSRVEDMIEKPDTMARQIDKAVVRMLARFPARIVAPASGAK